MFNLERAEELAKSMGISNSFLSKKLGRTSASLFVDWRKGKSKPKDSDIEQLAILLHTTTDYLTGKTDIKNRPPELDGLPSEIISIVNRVQKLSPDNLSKLSELIDLYLGGQGSK